MVNHIVSFFKASIKAFLIRYFYKFYIKISFNKNMGYRLNLNTPKTLNEKIQWLKVYYRDPIMTKCADKFGVREIIKQLIGEEYLIDIYGIYDNVDSINFDQLPNQFVLKPTHSSGRVLLCNNKKELNINLTKKTIKKWLQENYYYENGEWVYKDIKPQIICEKLLDSNIKDYKFYFFHGIKRLLLIVENRYQGTKTETFLDIDNNKLVMQWGGNPIGNAELPHKYNEMVELSIKLAKRFPFVRVDWYEVNGRIYFGELTFFPADGFASFNPEIYDKIFGDMLHLEKCDKKFVKKRGF